MKLDGKLFFVVAGFSALALWPVMSGAYGLDLVTKIMIYAIFALSLELLVGGTGLVCFGHAAFFGIGAYAAVLGSPGYDPANLLVVVALAVGASGLYALAVGALSLRAGSSAARSPSTTPRWPRCWRCSGCWRWCCAAASAVRWPASA